MKRLLSSLLLTLYLLSSVGLTLRAHYCGGDLASLGLFTEEKCCCEDSHSRKPDDCCKNEQKSIKLPDEQLKAENRQILPDLVTCLPQALPGIPTVLVQGYPVPKNISLPVSSNNKDPVPVYKRNHSFLFYS